MGASLGEYVQIRWVFLGGGINGVNWGNSGMMGAGGR
ncbi:hypothetical protein CPL00368_CDS0146 [Klebsiella phage DevonBitter]